MFLVIGFSSKIDLVNSTLNVWREQLEWFE